LTAEVSDGRRGAQTQGGSPGRVRTLASSDLNCASSASSRSANRSRSTPARTVWTSASASSALRGDRDDVPAPVRGITPAFDEFGDFEIVEDADQDARVDGEHLAQRLLAELAVLGEPNQGHALAWE
jgi:hypothetical protein